MHSDALFNKPQLPKTTEGRVSHFLKAAIGLGLMKVMSQSEPALAFSMFGYVLETGGVGSAEVYFQEK